MDCEHVLIIQEGFRMRFFHLSDLHIGLKLVNRDLREDQKYIFAQIAELIQL